MNSLNNTAVVISPKVAKTLWGSNAVFVYDTDEKISWQINDPKDKHDISHVDTLDKDNIVFYVKNDRYK